jgi:hypothetical protein
VVLSWSKRKSDYERMREYCGGDSEWRRPGRVVSFFASSFLSSSLSFHTLLSRIYLTRT